MTVSVGTASNTKIIQSTRKSTDPHTDTAVAVSGRESACMIAEPVSINASRKYGTIIIIILAAALS